MENIEKTYLVDKDECLVIITLEDIRDSYIFEDALGIIGKIYISKNGVMLYPETLYDELNQRRENALLKAFKEIFGKEEYNPLSGEYYNKITEMIRNGKLVSLGYNQESQAYAIPAKHNKK